MTIQDIIKVMSVTLKHLNSESVTGILYGSNKIPSYSSMCKKCPEICKLNLDICQKFYSEFEKEDISDRFCPFGFKITKKTPKYQYESNKISIYSINGFDKRKAYYSSNINISDFSRNLKSKYKVALEFLESSTNSYNEDMDLDFAYELLESLLVGRLSLYMRGLVHQIFTPLQGALSDLENIKIENGSSSSVSRLSVNLSSINQLSQQIQLLLSLSSEINANMLRHVTIHKVVDEIISSLSSSAEERFIMFRHNFNPFTTNIKAVPYQIQIVFSNILQNALKYSFSGFADRHLYIWIDYRSEGDFLIVDISNFGCQITQEEIHNRLIFDLGYRGIYSNDRQRKGTGSGLYIAEMIVKMHGGHIRVSSTLNRPDTYKTTFSIFLPLFFNGS